MTTVLSQKGQVVLPAPIRECLRLAPGDDFEVSIEDNDTITLRRISRPANRGLIDHLLSCPSSFEIPARETDDSKALVL
jgi:AbrB family looped-hinge helix DNA binding protein